MKAILFSIAVFTITQCAAQTGEIVMMQDSSIQHVLKLYQTFATEKRQVNGYRIQLASNNNRQDLLNMKAKFIQQYTDANAYIQYAAPQFKLRVGDFKTRAAADVFLAEVRIYFPSAFIVPDKIVLEGVEW